LTVFLCKHHVSSYVATENVVLNDTKENFTWKLHSVILEEEIKHFNWRDFKVELCYIIEVSVWKSIHCLAPCFTDNFCMVSTTALFVLCAFPYHFSLWIKSRSWKEMLAVWTTSESELFSSWCFFTNTVSSCELSCVISPSPSSYVPSYISFADPDFTALLPTVGTNGCIKLCSLPFSLFFLK
jgi:hypothetical protein